MTTSQDTERGKECLRSVLRSTIYFFVIDPDSSSLLPTPHPIHFLIWSWEKIEHSKESFGEGNGTPLQYSCLEKSHGWRSLEGCSPWGRWGSDTTERLHFHFSLSCIGEGNGNPLQCSCLENPRDRGAWWAAIYGVAESRTRLKRLSSSSSNQQEVVKLYLLFTAYQGCRCYKSLFEWLEIFKNWSFRVSGPTSCGSFPLKYQTNKVKLFRISRGIDEDAN